MENHYEQEMYENVPFKGQGLKHPDVHNNQIPYLGLEQDPDEFQQIYENDRDLDEFQQIYENTEMGTEPRYVSDVTVHEKKPEQTSTLLIYDVPDRNETRVRKPPKSAHQAHKNEYSCETNNNEEETVAVDTDYNQKKLPSPPNCRVSLPLTPKQNNYQNKVITVFVVMTVVMFTIGFVVAWFAKGTGTGMKEIGTGMKDTECNLDFKTLEKEMTTCSHKETLLISETQSGKISPEDRVKLITMVEQGMSLRVAYLQDLNNTDTWTFADAVAYYNTENGDIYFQLYQSLTNLNTLRYNSSLSVEWTMISTNGKVDKVVYAVGSGQPILSHNYKSPLKWFVTNRNTKVLYDSTNKTMINSLISRKKQIGQYIKQGYDLTNAYLLSETTGGFKGFFSSNLLLHTGNNISIAQYLELVVLKTRTYYHTNFKNDKMRFMQLSNDDDVDIAKYNIEKPSLLPTGISTLPSKWLSNNCWTLVHKTWKNKPENNDTLQQLLLATKNGHKIRVSLQDSQNNSISFKPELLIIRNNHLYGLHIWKAKVSSTNKIKIHKGGLWEWSIVSTKGDYLIQNCKIGGNICNNSQRVNITSMNWAIDTYKWEPIFQKKFPRTHSSCGKIATLISHVSAGKAVRYMVHDLISNTFYFHQTHHIEVQDNTEVIIKHMNEVLLQWDVNQEIKFASSPTMIHRQVSSTGSMLQHMWLFGGTHASTAMKYNYLEGNQYSLTWFIANKNI